MNLKDVGDRFAKYLETHQRKSINRASVELDLHPSQVYNIVKGKNYGVSYLFRILNHYVDINPLWLLKGEGEMLLDGPGSLKTSIPIPVFDVTATAGKETNFLDQKEAATDYISMGIEFKGCTAAVRIYGDSMYPLYQSGDLIVVKDTPKNSYIQWGHTYLIITKEDRLLKHIHKGSTQELYLLKSYNEEYYPFEIPKKNILKIFEVHGYVRKIKM